MTRWARPRPAAPPPPSPLALPPCCPRNLEGELDLEGELLPLGHALELASSLPSAVIIAPECTKYLLFLAFLVFYCFSGFSGWRAELRKSLAPVCQPLRSLRKSLTEGFCCFLNARN